MDEFSHPDISRAIDASGADYLLAALGAEKGQRWIERNRAALTLLRQARLDAERRRHVTGVSSRLSPLCRSYGADDLIG